MARYIQSSDRKRVFEVVAMVVVTFVLIGLSRLETRFFELSQELAKSQDTIITVAYFGLINFNVILILILSFLLFRNVTKLVLERKRGVFGSNLRTKLVTSLVFFAIAPTILMFYVSSRFIINSFDEWFSEKVRVIMEETKDAGALVYKQDQKRLESLASIALQRVKVEPISSVNNDDAFVGPPIQAYKFLTGDLSGFASQYGLDQVRVYDLSGNKHSVDDAKTKPLEFSEDILEVIDAFKEDVDLWSTSLLVASDQQDVVKGIAPIRAPDTGRLLGLIVAETRFETQILKSIEAIQHSFANIKPSAQLIKLSYQILLVAMCLLIAFCAVWLGFYVAKGITGPIQNLAEATREVALGNYTITLTPKTDDEAGQLIRSFNLMTKDLQSHRERADRSRVELEHSNEELDQRRKYMEVVLKNITAGVVSLDTHNRVTSLNDAAESLLGVSVHDVMNKEVKQAFGPKMFEVFWQPIQQGLSGTSSFTCQVELTDGQEPRNIVADATRITDEHGEDFGVIIVFDDATEKVRIQRAAAWREVARRIAHEIKNPVTPIKLSAQRLLRRFGERFEGEEGQVFQSCLETILKQVDSLRDLVNEFSKFARLPAIKPRMANIETVIHDVVKMYTVSYPHITFQFESQDIPPFLLDKDQMNRVFVNLISNSVASIDATTAGHILVECSLLRDMNTVRVEVIDNGCGIPVALKSRVLEPYFSTKDEGTGLGLAIVNQIITDHGGYLRIADNDPIGTRVIIELPLGTRELSKA